MARFDLVGALIALVSPQAAYRREAWQQGYAGLKEIASERNYAAAKRDRLTSDWFANGASADAALARDLPTLRNRCRQMRRDDPYAAAATRVLVTHLIGDGITVQASHKDPDVASLAQEIWDGWAASPVDGQDDFYGVQKQTALGLIDGDCLIGWTPVDGLPDMACRVLEGDYLAQNISRRLPDGGKIIQGVEFDPAGRLVAFWLFPSHPGDIFGVQGGGSFGIANRLDARDFDFVLEKLRPGQTRGVPWLYAAMEKLRDVSEIEQSIRVKKRIEACLSIFRKPGEGQNVSPLGEQKTQVGMSNLETLRPGMIIQGQPGEDITVINPSQSGDGDRFLRGEKMSASAAMGVPYHLVTGDVSQANYSSLRADIVPYYQRLDDLTFNVIVPRLCDPAFKRQMRREAIVRQMPALLEVTTEWTPAPRPWVDPLKEMTAEKMEMRSIPGEFARAMTRRGLNWRKEMKLQAEINALNDSLRLASDSDPRRVDGMGAIQAAAPYLSPKAGQDLAEEIGLN